MNALRSWFEYIIERYKMALTVVVIAFVAIVTLLMQKGVLAPSDGAMPPASMLSEKIRVGATPIPAYTPSIDEQLAESEGFAALISYTDRGFEPREVEIARGDAVRFTNNSSGDIWIAAGAGRGGLYPLRALSCGSSDLDTCGMLKPQEFWEFTFEVRGEWHVTNNLDKSKSVLVRVE